MHLSMTCLVAAVSLPAPSINNRRIRACFATWAATNTAWAFYDLTHGLPAQGCLMCVYAGLAVWGWTAWRRRIVPAPREAPVSRTPA